MAPGATVAGAGVIVAAGVLVAVGDTVASVDALRVALHAKMGSTRTKRIYGIVLGVGVMRRLFWAILPGVGPKSAHAADVTDIIRVQDCQRCARWFV